MKIDGFQIFLTLLSNVVLMVILGSFIKQPLTGLLGFFLLTVVTVVWNIAVYVWLGRNLKK